MNAPIPKKDYSIPLTGMELLQEKYLRNHKCWNLSKILNYHSRFDYTVNSGNSTVVIEHKNRYAKSISAFNSAMLEKEKYENLLKAKELLSAPAFYIMEFVDAILIYEIFENSNYKWELMPCPKSETDPTIVMKPCTLIPYDQATWIIGKKNWERASSSQLAEYIRRKRND